MKINAIQLKLLSRFIFLFLLPQIGSTQQVLNLNKCLMMAKRQNLSLKTKSFEIQKSEADIITATLRPNLALNSQTLITANKYVAAPSAILPNPTNNQLWWQITKPLQPLHVRKYSQQVAKERVQLEKHNYAEEERHLLFTVANQYLDVWASWNKIKFLEQAKINMDSFRAINQLRYNKQIISEIELKRAILLNNSYTVELNKLKQKYVREKHTLAYLLNSSSDFTIDSNSIETLNVPDNFDSLLHIAFENRSDLHYAKASVEVSQKNILLQRASNNFQPEIGFIYNPQNNVPYLGSYITIPIPIFSRNQGEIKKSQFVAKQAKQNLEDLTNLVKIELFNEYNNYFNLKNQSLKYQELIKNSNEILATIKYAYLQGATTIIDFLEAQRTWLELQENYFDYLTETRSVYIRLLYVSGIINKNYLTYE
ncbi:MAG: TolC family protein [Alphaproteobacteria bacterium]|nr:TolC family protein [Alphaproteobacteria bacterium]